MSETVTLVMGVLGAGGAALLSGVAGALAGRASKQQVPQGPAAKDVAERLLADARIDRDTFVRHAEIGAREEALVLRAEATTFEQQEEERLVRLAATLAGRQADIEARGREAAEAAERLKKRQAPLALLENERAQHVRATAQAVAEVRTVLQKVAGERAEEMKRALVEAELEAARTAGAQLVRQASEITADAETHRRAKRLLGIATGRFEGHYLTERHHSVITLGTPRNGKPVIAEADLAVIEATAGIKITLLESADAVRLEGLDGVGREVARRALARLLKRVSSNGAAAALGEAVVGRLTRDVAAELDREVMELGRRAFSVLEIERAHPDIVRLVGRLNWRTSYTQNQWKHAVEASFLCGMMAEELGLDRKVARRAALMHDIGKALTHEMDGSHAVIGADYARRLGESELVANAIGAHHTDEPFNSAYAYLVAASDAMSGARPGARRQQEDNHMAKIADLERLSRGFPGVAEAYAVQGGREVRVVVNEAVVDDAGAVQLSSDIAGMISQEMTFPGQIRVTVIRELRAIERAGG
jgi:ribonuclease Y